MPSLRKPKDTVPTKMPASSKPTPKNKKPGRPEGAGNYKEQILDAAEQVFAVHGYAGTSLREIAGTAHVTQALITYYFKSKLQLFEQVFLRRSHTIAQEREDGLRDLRKLDKHRDVKRIVQAFLKPAIAQRSTPGGRAFLQLQARLNLEPPEVSNRLRDLAYTESTRRYVQALQGALPKLSTQDAYWRMIAMIGAYLYTVSDTNRIQDYAPGICDPEDPDEILDQLTRFIVAGFKAA